MRDAARVGCGGMVRGRERQQKGLGAPVAKTSGKKSGAGKPKPKIVAVRKSVALKAAKPAPRTVAKVVPAKTAKPLAKAPAKPIKASVAPAKPVAAAKPAAPAKPVAPVKQPVPAKIVVPVKSPASTKPVIPAKPVLTGLAIKPPGKLGFSLKSGKLLKKAKLKPRIDDTPVRLPPKPVTSDSKMQKNRAGLSAKELEHFRALLLEKRRELLGDVSSMEREALRSGNTNLSNLPLHMADTGTDNYEQEFTLGLVEKDRQLLREIQVALAKIQDGSYGVCEGTGKPISVPRLEAQPWAKYSIEYARALEKPMFRRAY